MKTFILNWKNLNHYQEIFSVNDVQGIYSWGFKIDDIYYPYYVGKAINIKNRLIEHINMLYGGRYTIILPEGLKDIKKIKSDLKAYLETNLIIYVPKWPDGYCEFLNKRNDLSPHIDYMIEHFHFSYCELPDISDIDLSDVEKECLLSFGLENLINTRAGKTNITIENKGCSIILSKMKKSNEY